MSITSKVDICNLALDLLRGGVVQNIDEPSSPTEVLLSKWYDLCRKKTLREHPWNFAIKRVILAPDADSPAFGYDKKFPLPVDFLRLLTITSSSWHHETIISPTEYQVENHNILISNNFGDITKLQLKYIYDYEDVVFFDPLYVHFLAHDIALSIAFIVTESDTSVRRLELLRKEYGALARAIDAQERPPTRIKNSKFLVARTRQSSSYPHLIGG